MLFHSLEFLVFFPIVVLLYFALPLRYKNYWLLFASYVFYMSWNPVYGLLLFGCTFVTWGAALLVERVGSGGQRRALFAAALLAVFGALFYYKYMNFVLANVGRVLLWLGVQAAIPKFDIILPVGISFFTFQAAGYLIDVYRKDIYAERNFFRYALFVSFFPQLVAGPIERSKNLLKQLDKAYPFEYERVRRGLLIMLWGFFLKLVIADRCALLVDTVFGKPQNYSGIQLIVAAVLFSVQIYCDFMGYSTIARGAALVIGYRLMENFRQPYFATSVQEFWRRWHISLSTWFRDYLYIPLGGSRVQPLRRYLNLMVTFFVSGLWHGASWHFVVWGGLHGLFLTLEGLLAPWTKRTFTQWNIDPANSLVRFLAAIKTFFLATIAWVFFRASSVEEAVNFLLRSTNLQNIGIVSHGGLYKLGLEEKSFYLLLIGMIILAVFSHKRTCHPSFLSWLSSQKPIVRYCVYWVLTLMLTFSINLSEKEFIYFQF